MLKVWLMNFSATQVQVDTLSPRNQQGGGVSADKLFQAWLTKAATALIHTVMQKQLCFAHGDEYGYGHWTNASFARSRFDCCTDFNGVRRHEQQ